MVTFQLRSLVKPDAPHQRFTDLHQLRADGSQQLHPALATQWEAHLHDTAEQLSSRPLAEVVKEPLQAAIAQAVSLQHHIQEDGNPC